MKLSLAEAISTAKTMIGKLEDGDEVVCVLKNASLILGMEGDTLKLNVVLDDPITIDAELDMDGLLEQDR